MLTSRIRKLRTKIGIIFARTLFITIIKMLKMFPKQLSLLFFMLIFMSCSQANPSTAESGVDKGEMPKHNDTASLAVIPADKQEPEIQQKTSPDQVVIKTISPKASGENKENKELPKKDKTNKQPEARIIEADEQPGPAENHELTTGATPSEIEDTAVEGDKKLSHDSWNELLEKYVTANGKVNYSGLKADKAKLQSYLDLLAANPVQSAWTRNEKMAYWINAYNAFTIKLIVDHYPVSSITKIEGGKPWDKKWIKLGDKTYSLNQIENEILRPQFSDPRIHFAVNCAAKSCPPLLNRAWTADNLEQNFETQTVKFVNNPQFNVLTEKKIQLSKIFEWYAGDFGDIVSFLNKYSKLKINANAKVTYIEYDWALNE